MSADEARENLRKAREALAAAQKAQLAAERTSFEATRDYVQHRVNKPNPARGHAGDPAKWDPSADADLRKNMWDKQTESIVRINELNQAKFTERNATTALRRAEGARGLQAGSPPAPAAPAPNPAGCLPKCGNENPTVPQIEVQAPGGQANAALEVGSAGAANSLQPPGGG